jgi:hypothetical protein
MYCLSLLHELGHDQTKTMKELLNITTRHASREEVVRAIFMQSSSKEAPSGDQGMPTKAVDKGAKWGARSDKRGLKWWASKL